MELALSIIAAVLIWRAFARNKRREPEKPNVVFQPAETRQEDSARGTEESKPFPVRLTMELVVNHSYSVKAKDNLLSRFERGQDVADLPEYWDDKLGEDRLQVMKQFQRDGLIEPMPLAEKLEYVFNLVELKPMCKARGLKVSGRKVELANRLAEADASGMQQLVGSKNMMWLTLAGKAVVMDYYAGEIADYKAAEAKILEHLSDGNLTDAIAVSHRYKSNMLWPSGSDEDFDMNVLSGILSSPLGNRDERFLAALMFLLPQSYPGKWVFKKEIGQPVPPA